MPDRQSRHPDNDLIHSMTDAETPSQSSGSTGKVNAAVGSRAEGNRATDPDNREPVTGSDNPEQDARKGDKTMAKIKSGDQN